MKLFSVAIPALLFTVLLSACSDSKSPIRHYVEVAIPAPSEEASGDRNPAVQKIPETGTPGTPLVNADAKGHLHWTAPEGWADQGRTGMREATFTIERDGAKGECTIVVLGPESREVIPNLQRWIGQLNVPVPSEADLAEFVKQAPTVELAGGRSAGIYDLTRFAPEGGDAVLASIADFGNRVIFVKLNGPQALLTAEFGAFKTLTASLHE